MSSLRIMDLIMGILRKTKAGIGTRLSVPLDDFIAKQLNFTDSMIADAKSKECLSYGAGKLTVSVLDSDPDNFSVLMNLYFTNENQKIIEKKTEMKFPLFAIDEAARIELLGKKSIVYDVDPPI